MRVLAICESTPTLDPRHGNGSTLISTHVLRRLPPDMDLDLMYFADSPAEPDPLVLARSLSVQALPLRSRASAALRVPATRLPPASWRRGGGAVAVEVGRRSLAADVVYLHGVQTFGLLVHANAPVVANEVDPWALHVDDSDVVGTGPAAAPLRAWARVQARRYRVLERSAGRWAAEYLLVNDADARQLARVLGRVPMVIPNGTSVPNRTDPESRSAAGPAGAATIVFVGTLDYPPNVDAVTRLCRDVLPIVRGNLPEVTVRLVGRRPAGAVRRLAGRGVELVGEVPDVTSELMTATVAAYPGDLGHGMKNTVREALAAGCPVVASTTAARGLRPGPGLVIADTPVAMAHELIRLLDDGHAREHAARDALSRGSGLPSWDEVAARYAEVLRAAATPAGVAGHRAYRSTSR